MTSLRFCASPFLDFRAQWALDTTTAWPELMFSLSSPQEERDGERRRPLLNALLPVPLPTRASRGEGENFWWFCQDAPRGNCVLRACSSTEVKLCMLNLN